VRMRRNLPTLWLSLLDASCAVLLAISNSRFTATFSSSHLFVNLVQSTLPTWLSIFTFGGVSQLVTFIRRLLRNFCYSSLLTAYWWYNRTGPGFKALLVPKDNFKLYNTGCFKKSFTTLKAYRNLYRGHTQRFELSKCGKTHRVLPRIVMVQCDFHW